MKKGFHFLLAAVFALILLSGVVVGCKSNSTTSTTGTKPISGAVINSDSLVTATITGITRQTSGYPWKLEVMIKTALDVNNLPNPVSGSIGKIVTVFTDEDMSSFKVDNAITAQIKYVGDVDIPAGISLYMYTIALDKNPLGY